MRKVILAAVLAALGFAALAVPASASFDHHFTVLEKATFHELPNRDAFRIRGQLFDPRNHDNKVGNDHGRCKIRPHGVLRCRGITHLNGEIGGSGDIKYRGNYRRDDFRLNVTGGSGDFNGVAGKLVFENLNESGTKSLNHFDLVR